MRRLRLTPWRLLGIFVVIIGGVLLGYIFAEIIDQDREVTLLAQENEFLREDVVALSDQVISLGEEPVSGPAPSGGNDGLDGQDGRDGLDGQDGQDGRDGIDGQDGADGVDGRDGADSVVPGPPGPPGPAGADGADGTNGTNGVDGEDGADSTVPGPQGIQGIPGPACPEGYTPTVVDSGPLAGWIACAPIQEAA
jgi:hypothetical protein